jgi:hypothetical protein
MISPFLCIFFTFFCLPVRCFLLYSSCAFFFCCLSVRLSVCLSVFLSVFVLIYLCLSVRLPNLSHVSVFHAPSHICHVLPSNTQYGRSRGVCLSVCLSVHNFLYLYCLFYLSPCSLSVCYCLSVCLLFPCSLLSHMLSHFQ